MPTNVYISQGSRSEQNLYEDLVIESIRFYGSDVFYLPREIVIQDDVLNEDIESSFNDAYAVEVYVESVDGFEGDGNLLSKFGLEIRDSVNLIVAKRRWEQLIGKWNNNITAYRPKEGDLIYVPFSKSLFEIKFVEHEKPFYQLKNLPVYELQCELFEYRSEKIATGFDELDRFERSYANASTYKITGGGTAFVPGEKITQTIDDITVTGEIALFVRNKQNINEAEIRVVGITSDDDSARSFAEGSIINEKETNDTWSISQVYSIKDGDDKFTSNDKLAQNSTFETTADEIIDFTEKNPFGEISK